MCVSRVSATTRTAVATPAAGKRRFVCWFRVRLVLHDLRYRLQQFAGLWQEYVVDIERHQLHSRARRRDGRCRPGHSTETAKEVERECNRFKRELKRTLS